MKKVSVKNTAFWNEFCVFPFLFIAWEYYNTGSFIHSCITCCRDFAWPAAVVVA